MSIEPFYNFTVFLYLKLTGIIDIICFFWHNAGISEGKIVDNQSAGFELESIERSTSD